MATELEKPRITEVQVRMDCNGCVQKIKKALHGINGIYEVYIDFPDQKITIVGRADPEKIVKAIKKSRKSAVICCHTEQQPNHLMRRQPKPKILLRWPLKTNQQQMRRNTHLKCKQQTKPQSQRRIIIMLKR
ncbi:heavy metal-associated isoprenylated plant protein 36-like [Ipomoea triloba]|uniref:heavy metal-associated isoprenylated plant protein 36-like n=1 Tax=Ipomoea triloba TaxID=35885 RepID=UPI00125D607B|nr:heavy metal-associated isoprenylated plant protein 36-like [Ipomoea triloba]